VHKAVPYRYKNVQNLQGFNLGISLETADTHTLVLNNEPCPNIEYRGWGDVFIEQMFAG